MVLAPGPTGHLLVMQVWGSFLMPTDSEMFVETLGASYQAPLDYFVHNYFCENCWARRR